FEWDGTDWAQFDGPARLPVQSAMTYDGSRQSVVSFGGALSGIGYIRATNGIWERLGTVWTVPPVEPDTYPRFIQSISKDPSRPTLPATPAVPAPPPPTGLWTFDGLGWQGPNKLPSGFNEQTPAMTLDELHAVAIVFGGRIANAPFTRPALDDRLW